MSFFALPDRQVVYLLDYLRTGINSHKYVKNWFDTADAAVASCFTFNPQKARVYKDEYGWKINSAELPALGIWRTSSAPMRDETFTPTKGICGFGWFAHIPEGSEYHIAESWGNTFANNMWHVCKDLLSDIPSDTRQKGGFDVAYLGDGAFGVDEDGTFCGFLSEIEIKHHLPPYEIDDMDAFIQMVVDIKLYDSATVGGDELQGLYQGLTTEAEIEPTQS